MPKSNAWCRFHLLVPAGCYFSFIRTRISAYPSVPIISDEGLSSNSVSFVAHYILRCRKCLPLQPWIEIKAHAWNAPIQTYVEDRHRRPSWSWSAIAGTCVRVYTSHMAGPQDSWFAGSDWSRSRRQVPGVLPWAEWRWENCAVSSDETQMWSSRQDCHIWSTLMLRRVGPNDMDMKADVAYHFQSTTADGWLVFWLAQKRQRSFLGAIIENITLFDIFELQNSWEKPQQVVSHSSIRSKPQHLHLNSMTNEMSLGFRYFIIYARFGCG